MKITKTTVKNLALIIAASVLMLDSHRASSAEPLNGNITYLFAAVFDGKKTWNQPVPLSAPIEVDQTQ